MCPPRTCKEQMNLSVCLSIAGGSAGSAPSSATPGQRESSATGRKSQLVCSFQTPEHYDTLWFNGQMADLCSLWEERSHQLRDRQHWPVNGKYHRILLFLSLTAQLKGLTNLSSSKITIGQRRPPWTPWMPPEPPLGLVRAGRRTGLVLYESRAIGRCWGAPASCRRGWLLLSAG